MLFVLTNEGDIKKKIARPTNLIGYQSPVVMPYNMIKVSTAY